ncbi:hypothetical protein LWI29_015320 [Acer saccharum]|uniref:Protein kinase domain-containing protein n=1 Tax=Acer saccharum TaxID=4024 RepID=A0AA39S366_ACESA|nr:hypothetical protein LWI29_015320 [Acer saccharum]
MSFSTAFVFSIKPKYPELGGHGLAFTLMSTKQPMYCLANQCLGLPNDTTNALYSTRYLRSGIRYSFHHVHGWSFKIGGRAQELDITELPSLAGKSKIVHRKGFAVGITLASITLVFLLIVFAAYVIRRIINGKEVLQEWEIEYGAHRFRYPEFFIATRGFQERNLVGLGGFGKVYRRIIPSTGIEVAIKRVAHDLRRGMKEFVAEITSMGRLRHQNLVELHGWCWKQDELLLVYDYIPNGSLDKLLFDNEDSSQKKKILAWDQRYAILIGVAQAVKRYFTFTKNVIRG